MCILNRILVLFLFTAAVHAQEATATIEVEILNIENNEGQMMIGLYDAETNWLKRIYKGGIGKIENGTSAFVFSGIPEGTYAISVFHDEDNDGELKTFLGIPREATGSSNDAPARFGPPKWKEAKFEVSDGVVKKIINL